jgi:hypothetical protein
MSPNVQQMSFDLTSATIGGNSAPIDSEPPVALTGRARTVFEAMRAIVESPDCILRHYKQDFYKYDAAYLARTHAIGLHAWILRDAGTHLVRVGVHRRMHEELLAGLAAGGASAQIYLIDPEKVSIKKIDAARARELATRFEYITKDQTVYKNGQPLAWLDVRFTPWRDGRLPQGVVRIEAHSKHLSKGDLIALRQIAECEVIDASHSLFTGTESCTIEGRDVFELIDEAK